MKVGSLFSGVGGMDMGLEAAGMEVVWQCEKDKQARSVLRRHWPDTPIYEDVHDVGIRPRTERQGQGDRTTDLRVQSTYNDGETYGDRTGGLYGGGGTDLVRPDLICGGFPCQDYSVAGKRGGLAGDRGGLWWQMHRIIAELGPTLVIGENVPGLLSSNGGRDFIAIIASLVQLGYGCTWAVLDSQYFGVAQRRRRLFIVGHSGGVPRPEILALSEGLFGHPAPSREAGQDVAASLTRGADSKGKGGYAGRRRAALGATKESAVFDTTQVTSKANRSNPKPGDPCHPLAAGAHAPLLAEMSACGGSQQDEFVTGALAHSSNTHGGNHQPKTFQGTIPRRLTPLECERLQAWPDDWTRYGVTEEGKTVELRDSPRYRMCGNGVTRTVAEWMAHRIMEVG